MEQVSLEVIERDAEYKTLSQNAESALAYANKLTIKNTEGHGIAIAALAKVVNEKKRGDAMRRFFTDPLNEQVKKINSLFMPTVKTLEEAEQKIRTAMRTYQDDVTRKADAAKAKTMEKIEAGKISVEQGVKKIENIKMPEKTVRTEEATVSYRIVKKVIIAEPEKLPREYLVPDEMKIRKVALAGVEIPGVKVIEEKTPSIRGN